jgi:hypothetical protein
LLEANRWKIFRNTQKIAAVVVNGIVCASRAAKMLAADEAGASK